MKCPSTLDLATNGPLPTSGRAAPASPARFGREPYGTEGAASEAAGDHDVRSSSDGPGSFCRRRNWRPPRMPPAPGGAGECSATREGTRSCCRLMHKPPGVVGDFSTSRLYRRRRALDRPERRAAYRPAGRRSGEPERMAVWSFLAFSKAGMRRPPARGLSATRARPRRLVSHSRDCRAPQCTPSGASAGHHPRPFCIGNERVPPMSRHIVAELTTLSA